MKVGLKLKTLSNPETENTAKDYTKLYGKDFSVLYKCNSLNSGYGRDPNNNNEINQRSNYYKQVIPITLNQSPPSERWWFGNYS